MKVLAALCGALLCWFLTFVVFSVVSDIQVGRPGYTPDDDHGLIGVFLMVSPVALVLGGWIGVHLYRRWRGGSQGPKTV
jgi:predicted MFS family arabinose efflux permease